MTKREQEIFTKRCQRVASWYGREANTMLALLTSDHPWPDADEAKPEIVRLQQKSANFYEKAREEFHVLQNGGTSHG